MKARARGYCRTTVWERFIGKIVTCEHCCFCRPPRGPSARHRCLTVMPSQRVGRNKTCDYAERETLTGGLNDAKATTRN